jgi:hypothetical protein
MMQQEIRLKLGPRAEDREPLQCPVEGCDASSGRIGRIEVFRDLPDSSEEVYVGFDCSRGHRWYIAFIDGGGELFYAARGWTPIEDVPHSKGRVFVDDE